MKPRIGARLSVMMFLQFFTWGSWFATIAVYMAKNGMELLTQWPFTMFSVASLIAPFFVGLVADRFFATEKVLALLHVLGGIVMLVIPSTAQNPVLFIGLLLLYNVCYMPTIGLANSLAFNHIEDQEKQFPYIRVFGTIGWIAAGLVISFVLSRFVTGMKAEESALPLFATGVSGILLGIYCLSLPHTPPKAAGQKVSVRSVAGIDAIQHLGSRSFYVLMICSLLIWIPLSAYYNFTQIYLQAAQVENIAATQTLGQASEVIFMLLMPLLFARLGVKWMLGVGMLAWVVRYVLFAAAAPASIFWMILLGILLHGICFDFFFVTLQIYVDKKATPAIRAQAQGFIVLVTYGIGFLIGSQAAGYMYNRFLSATKQIDPLATALTMDQWQSIWWILAGLAGLVFLLFISLFKDDTRTETPQLEARSAR